jgi:transcriptional regulator with GAF, ATPase, and Fis domain
VDGHLPDSIDIYQPDFLAAADLLLRMARERSADRVLQMVVDQFASREQVIALSRIWLIGPGDRCSTCHMRPMCPDQRTCLHLVTSAGRSRAGADFDYSRTDDEFSRIPIGVLKVGEVAATRQFVLLENITPDSPWIVDPEWVRREGIIGFAGLPLFHQDEVIGVFANFLRMRLPPELLDQSYDWLRMITDHVSVAVMNGRAFDEVERLRRRLEAENTYLKEEIRREHGAEEMVGESVPWLEVLRTVRHVAPTDATVLIQGETGTGKELIAHTVHAASARRHRPLVKVNCAAISPGLVESELFGHVKGAFTGALERRTGRFELADGGTLFLDEVSELSLEMQAKLLRVLQGGEFEPVGSSRTVTVNVRIIAATNRDPEQAVRAGQLRADLFYRLNVVPLVVPPLRERVEDIPRLTTFFVSRYARQFGKQIDAVEEETMDLLARYPWPGNVRELENIIERAVVLTDGPFLRVAPALLRTAPGGPHEPKPQTAVDGDRDTLAEVERRHVLAVLERTRFVVEGPLGAAHVLGLHPNTLRTRMKKLGIRRPDHGIP